MDLTRGICILCTNNNGIIVPPQAENTTFLLKDILPDQIDYKKFEKINPSLKVCPICIHDLITVSEHRKNIKETFSEDCDTCVLCYSETHLVHITDWVHFDKKLKNVTSERRPGKCLACLNCIKCLDLLDRIRTNLFKKYPNLELIDFNKDSKLQKTLPTLHSKSKIHKKRKETHTNSTIQFTSDEESDYSSPGKANTINNLKAALKHLKPLKSSPFKIDKFKQDKKLLKQIAFVKLFTKDYKKLDHSPEWSQRSANVSDTDSSRDSPSSKHSFFKIKLKINPNKVVKTQRVLQGKVAKLKGHKSKAISEKKKELVVRLVKMNFDQVSSLNLNAVDIRTPTKASRKMLPDECTSSSKKRKSVTFADVLDTEIIGGNTKENADTTPLKSSLKRRISSNSSLLNKDSDESNNEDGTEHSLHSEEELETPKSYVEDIIKNNDNIFDSLKASESTETKHAKVKELGHSSSIDGNSNDSDTDKKSELDSENNKIDEPGKKEEKIDTLEDKKKKLKQIDTQDSESEKEKAGDKEETPNENESKKIGTEYEELEKNNRNRIKVHNESENKSDENKVISEETKKNKNRNQAKTHNSSDDNDSDDVSKSENKKDDICFVDIATINNEESNISAVNNEKEKTKDSHRSKKSKKSKTKKHHQKHKKRKRPSVSDSDLEEEKLEKKGKHFSENEDQQSTENYKIVRSDVEEGISLSKCFQDAKKPNGSETSIEDKDVTLEEFKALRKSNSPDAGSEKIDETNSSTYETNEDSETLILNDEDITDTINNQASTDNGDDNVDKEMYVIRTKDKNKQTNKNHSSDIESESEKNNKTNGSYDSSDLKSKSKKQYKSTMKRQDEDKEVLSTNTGDEGSEEPETKREKVSGVDLNEADSNTSGTKKNDMPLEVSETQRYIGVIDNKVDDLIAKYTNPSIPNLNNDNVSDSQNAGAGGENQLGKPESPAWGSEEKVDLPIKVISDKSDDNVNATISLENNSDTDITKNNDSEATSNVIFKDLDIDDIMGNIVDSC